MSNYKGKFFVIEGIDGSGKGTQHELLVNRLHMENYRVSSVDFPQYETSFFGAMVGQMLRGDFGPMSNIHPKLASTIYALDRWQKSPFMHQVIENGGVLVANRYSLSNEGHQAARVSAEERQELLNWLREVEFGQLGIPKPDTTFFLDVPVEIAQVKIEEKAVRKYLGHEIIKDELERDVQNQLTALEIYREIARSSGGVITINCVENGELLPKEVIHETIWKETSRLLDPRMREGTIQGERQK